MDDNSTDVKSFESEFQFYGEITILVFLLLAGLAANIPLAIVYLKSKHIRSIADKFLFNLLIADVISVALLLPTILVDLVQCENNSSSFLASTSTMSSSQFSYPGTFTHLNGSNFTTEFSGEGVEGRSTFGLNPVDVNAADVAGEGDGMKTQPPHQIQFLLQLNNWSCMYKNGLLSAVATASVLAALEIAMERYLAVVTPLHYHKLLTRPTVFVTSVIGTFISIGSGIVSSFDPSLSIFPSCYATQRQSQSFAKRSQPNGLEEEYNQNEEFWWSTYNLGHFIIFFIFPVLLMTFIYISIWWEARRQKFRMNQRYKPFYLTVPNKLEDDLKDKPRFHPIVIRFKLMHRLKATRIDRAARVAVFTLVVTTLCWSPYYYVKASHAIQSIFKMYSEKTGDSAIPAAEMETGGSSWETVIPLLLTTLHPLLAPVFYAYRYKRLRQGILRVGLSPFYCCTSCNCAECDKSTNNIERQFVRNNCRALKTSQTTSQQTGNLAFSPNLIPEEGENDGTSSRDSLNPSSVTNSSPQDNNVMKSSNEEAKSESNDNLCKGHAGIEIHVLSEDGLDILVETDSDVIGEAGRLVERENPNCCLNFEDISSNNNNDGLEDSCANKAVASPSSLVNCLTLWMGSYSRRWNSHRESVTSTASFITLLSTRSNKIHPIANV